MPTNRSNTGALVAGALLIAFGLLWPFAVIGFDALFFVLMFTGGKQAAAFAIPGSIVGGIGLVLLFQNITNHWESMSYFWTLIILSVGAGIYIMGLYGGDMKQKQSGLRAMKVGFIIFIIFGAFFEMIFSSFNNILFPVLLILLGAYLVLSRSGLFGGRKNDESANPPIPPVS